MGIVECGGEGIGKLFIHHHVLGVAAVGVEAGELGVIAEVFLTHPAIGASAIRAKKPGHADSIALAKLGCGSAARFHDSDDLVSGDDWKFGKLQLAFNRMQVGMTHAAATNGYTNLAVGRIRFRPLAQLQGRSRNRRGMLENHSAHTAMVGPRVLGEKSRESSVLFGTTALYQGTLRLRSGQAISVVPKSGTKEKGFSP